MTDYQKGLLITGIGGLILTIDIPMIRLGGGDAISAQFTRSSFGLLAAFILWLGISFYKGRFVRLLPRRSGLFVAACYGVSAVAFVVAVFSTTTANLVFILTSITIFSALFGWWFLGEKPAMATLLTITVMIFAVMLIVSDSIETGNTWGDLAALSAAFFLSIGIIIARKSGENMGFAPMLGGVIPTLFAGFILLGNGGAEAFHLDAPLWTIANGLIIIPIAFWCLATGPKYLSGPEVGMFYLLETVLAPVWVWMIFQEVPTMRTLIGGAILIAALIAHFIWQMQNEKKRRFHAA